jgi:hypothetical protein
MCREDEGVGAFVAWKKSVMRHFTKIRIGIFSFPRNIAPRHLLFWIPHAQAPYGSLRIL